MFGVAIGVLLLWLASERVTWTEVAEVLARASYTWIAAALVPYYLALAVRAFRWWLVLRPIVGLSLPQASVALLVGYAVNVLLPVRLGELFRADFCRRQYGVPRTKVLGSIMIERFTDGVTVLVALAIGIAAIGTDSEFAPLVASLISAGSVVFAALGVALYILGSGVAERLTRRIPAVSTRFFALAESLATVRSQRMISVLAASFVVWLFDGAAMWGVLVACGVRLDVLAMCLAVGVVSLSTLLPSPPGFLGTMQFAFAIAASTFGYSWSQGIAAATINQVFLLGSMVVIGLALLLIAYSTRVYRDAKVLRPSSGRPT
jgi:uncharacterized protein (TIRG00374 family)